MAIQPIDLQTLFTQLDKVAKNQAAQREGLAIQQAIQGAEIQKKTEEHIQEVNEAQNEGEAERVNDRSRRKKNGEEGKEERGKDGEEAGTEEDRQVIRDPALGRNVDISG
ncbi:MAG: hypothetical protein LBL44_09160 [Treponema sp.]|jgi:hypothetical protein|nr:hypothetical protein [Treponema sp.]